MSLRFKGKFLERRKDRVDCELSNNRVLYLIFIFAPAIFPFSFS